MSSRISQWTLDVADVSRMADFWAGVLDYQIETGDDGSVHLRPPAYRMPGEPTMWLQPCGEEKSDKNRNHPDLRPIGGDIDGEVKRVEELGARRIDLGQKPDDPFVVLADPEGNEFCILR